MSDYTPFASSKRWQWYDPKAAKLPELPEIEHLKRTLEPLLIGTLVTRVELRRRDVLRSGCRRSPADTSTLLLRDQRIESLARHGKQLALIGSDGGLICIHLGMSGQLRFFRQGQRLAKNDHVHCVLWLRAPSPEQSGRLVFRDPRRFGGMWAFEGLGDLYRCRWDRLGPDALTIKSRELTSALGRTRRPIKAALLDQSVIAGVGNIYADEALHFAAIHPMTPSNMLDSMQARHLAGALRTVLRRAIAAGGSTLRDYSDANGEAGWFIVHHAVYGRSGLPCRQCGTRLERVLVAQRSTVYCPKCQRPAAAPPSSIHNTASG